MALSWQQNVRLAQNRAFFLLLLLFLPKSGDGSFEQLFVCKPQGFLRSGRARGEFALFPTRRLGELLLSVGELSLPVTLAGFITRFLSGGEALSELPRIPQRDSSGSSGAFISINELECSSPVPFHLFPWKMPVQTPSRTQLRDK